MREMREGEREHTHTPSEETEERETALATSFKKASRTHCTRLGSAHYDLTPLQRTANSSALHITTQHRTRQRGKEGGIGLLHSVSPGKYY